MKLYGYTSDNQATGQSEPTELSEVMLVATPAELRGISAFLTAAATSMESKGAQFSHEHLSDKQPGFEHSPHFIVGAKPNER